MEARLATDGVRMGIESHGVRLDLRFEEPSLVPAVLPLLPPGWRETDDPAADVELALVPDGASRFTVLLGSDPVSPPVDLDVALTFLEARIHETVALAAPERIFVHAGVVARNQRALLLPGRSFAGKSTLVAALVREGATYYSDEFAVLDPEGQVHPYPKPLSMRGPQGQPAADVHASELGGATGEGSVPVAVVAVTSYRPDAGWNPERLPPGEAALEMLSHTVAARTRPAEALGTVRRVAESCVCVRGERGDAEPVARALLSLLEPG